MKRAQNVGSESGAPCQSAVCRVTSESEDLCGTCDGRGSVLLSSPTSSDGESGPCPSCGGNPAPRRLTRAYIRGIVQQAQQSTAVTSPREGRA